MSDITIRDSVTFGDLEPTFNSLCQKIHSWKVDLIKRQICKLHNSRAATTVLYAVENRNYERLKNCGFSAYDIQFGIETIEDVIATLDMGGPL